MYMYHTDFDFDCLNTEATGHTRRVTIDQAPRNVSMSVEPADRMDNNQVQSLSRHPAVLLLTPFCEGGGCKAKLTAKIHHEYIFPRLATRPTLRFTSCIQRVHGRSGCRWSLKPVDSTSDPFTVATFTKSSPTNITLLHFLLQLSFF